VLVTWEQVLADLERDPMLCRDPADWVAKKWMLDAFVASENLAWDDPWLQSLDLEYHNVRREEGLYAELLRQGNIQRFVKDDEVRHAIGHPPKDTAPISAGAASESLRNK